VLHGDEFTRCCGGIDGKGTPTPVVSDFDPIPWERALKKPIQASKNGPGYPILPGKFLQVRTSLQQREKAHHTREECARNRGIRVLEGVVGQWSSEQGGKCIVEAYSIVQSIPYLLPRRNFPIGRRNLTRPKAEACLACVLRALSIPSPCLFDLISLATYGADHIKRLGC
jgi:hypothetical protein